MIQVKNLSARFGSFEIKNVSFSLREGEHFTLLGPSGAGKSLLSEIILGLRRYQSGEIRVGGEYVSGKAANRVAISYVPQDVALFPHLGVLDNILFGARVRRIESEVVKQRLKKISGILKIDPILKRGEIGTLSIGEMQRVALARALIIGPRVLFLDEPFSSLDYHIKRQLIEELKKLRRALSITIFHVTHDHEEAFMLADRIGVIFSGRLAQIGSPVGLQRCPTTLQVAQFLMARNIFDARISEIDPLTHRAIVNIGNLKFISTAFDKVNSGQGVYAVIRPEEVHIIRPNRPLGPKVRENLFQAGIKGRTPQPGGYLLSASLDGLNRPIEISVSNCAYHDLKLDVVDSIRVCLKSDSLWLIPKNRKGTEDYLY